MYQNSPCVVCSTIGCWFGVKDDDRRGVFIGDVEASALAAADAEGDPGKLGQALLDILFDDVTLAHGCVTKPRKEGIKQLDQARVHAIRGASLYIYTCMCIYIYNQNITLIIKSLSYCSSPGISKTC